MNINPLVIFDCDGVLVDSEAIECGVFADHLRQLGLAYTTERCIQEFSGLSLNSCRALVEAQTGTVFPPDFFQTLQADTFAQFTKSLKLVRDIERVLDFLDVAKVDYCVASSGAHEKIRFSLGHTGVLERFGDRIYSASNVENGKPAPDLFLYVAKNEGRTPEQCVVIEDSEPGIQAALAAGMRVCAYGTKYSSADSMTAFDTMASLPSMLAELLALSIGELTN